MYIGARVRLWSLGHTGRRFYTLRFGRAVRSRCQLHFVLIGVPAPVSLVFDSFLCMLSQFPSIVVSTQKVHYIAPILMLLLSVSHTVLSPNTRLQFVLSVPYSHTTVTPNFVLAPQKRYIG
jgi:hypothetical protein